MPLDIQAQSGPVIVTLAYVGLYYAFQIHGMRVKNALSRRYKQRGEKFDRYFGQDREMLAADRIQLNMLEHMPPFLALMWLNAVYVGPTGATVGGVVYLVARALYPVLIGSRLGRGIQAKVLIATVTGYAVLIYFSGALVVSLIS